MSDEIKIVIDPIGAIRTLSGVFSQNIDYMTNTLALINLITRVIDGDTDKQFADKILEQNNFKIDWNDTCK